MRRCFGTIALVALAGGCADSAMVAPSDGTAATAAVGAAGTARGIAPRQSQPRGRTYEAWAGRLMQWVAALPTSRNPFLDATGALTEQAQSGNVWFLMGPSMLLEQPQTADITMPVGTALVFAPLGIYATGPGGIDGDGDDTPDELRQVVEWLTGQMSGLAVEIDGRPVANIDAYRVVSATVPIAAPSDNVWTDVFGEPNPFTFGMFGGYALFLEPLPAGRHVLHAVSAVPDLGMSFDMTYHITVVPPHGR